MPDDLIDAEALALALGVSESTIRSWASRGRIRRFPQGHRRRTLYSLSEVRRVYTGETETTCPSKRTVQH